MADITRDDIFDKDLAQPLRELNEEFAKTLEMLKKTTLEADKTNSSLKSSGSDEAAASTRKLAEEQKKLIAAQKEQQKAADALQKQRQKALEQIAKQENAMRELVDASKMEAKTYDDMQQRLTALNKLRKQADLTTEQGRQAYAEMSQQVLQLNNDLKKMDSEVGMNQRKVGAYQEAIEGAAMSLGEMKRELRSLRNTSFSGMNPEQIAQVRARMAELTDQIGDFQAQIKTASADRIPALVAGFQGIISMAQLVTGTLSIFGIENEKLEKTMIQLIGVSQALSQLQEMSERRTLQNALAVAKDTYAKVANTIATKGMTLATEGASVASRGLGKALKSVPFIAIAAAIVAVVAGVVAFVAKMKEANIETKKHKLAMEEYKSVQDKIANATGDNVVKLKLLTETVKDNTLSEETRKKALKEIYDLTNGQVAVYGLSEASLKSLDIQTQKYIETLKLQAKAQARTEVAIEQYKKYYELKSKEVTSTKELKDKQQELLLL